MTKKELAVIKAWKDRAGEMERQKRDMSIELRQFVGMLNARNGEDKSFSLFGTFTPQTCAAFINHMEVYRFKLLSGELQRFLDKARYFAALCYHIEAISAVIGDLEDAHS